MSAIADLEAGGDPAWLLRMSGAGGDWRRILVAWQAAAKPQAGSSPGSERIGSNLGISHRGNGLVGWLDRSWLPEWPVSTAIDCMHRTQSAGNPTLLRRQYSQMAFLPATSRSASLQQHPTVCAGTTRVLADTVNFSRCLEVLPVLRDPFLRPSMAEQISKPRKSKMRGASHPV